MRSAGKRARRDRDRFVATLNRLGPKELAKARRILERLEECDRQRKAGLPAPIPTFDDILGERP